MLYKRMLPSGTAAAIISIGIACAGCLSGAEYTPIKRYALLAAVQIPASAPSPLSIGVRPLDYARFYKEPMIYRGENFEVGTYDYDQWAELPRDAVTRILVDALAETRRFVDVGYAHDLQRPDLVLTGELRRFDEIRAADSRSALCEVRFELRDRATGTVRWTETVSASAPHESLDAAGFAGAMNKAVAQLVATAVERIVEHAGGG